MDGGFQTKDGQGSFDDGPWERDFTDGPDFQSLSLPLIYLYMWDKEYKGHHVKSQMMKPVHRGGRATEEKRNELASWTTSEFIQLLETPRILNIV